MDKIQGDIALVKMDEKSEPVEFTKSNYEEFCKLGKDIINKNEESESKKREAEIEKEMENEEKFDDEDEAEEGEEEQIELDDDPESAAADFKDQLIAKILKFYQEEHGREPTIEEL
eukprot:UN26219